MALFGRWKSSIQQLNLIAEQIKLKSYLFKDNDDGEDSEDEDSETEDTDEDPNIFLKEMNCCFFLYLGSMSSNKGLDTPHDQQLGSSGHQ